MFYQIHCPHTLPPLSVTSAKLTEKFPEENDKDNDWSAPVGKSIRRKTVGFLSDTDRKYVGKKTSRKQLLDGEIHSLGFLCVVTVFMKREPLCSYSIVP